MISITILGEKLTIIHGYFLMFKESHLRQSTHVDEYRKAVGTQRSLAHWRPWHKVRQSAAHTASAESSNNYSL